MIQWAHAAVQKPLPPELSDLMVTRFVLRATSADLRPLCLYLWSRAHFGEPFSEELLRACTVRVLESRIEGREWYIPLYFYICLRALDKRGAVCENGVWTLNGSACVGDFVHAWEHLAVQCVGLWGDVYIVKILCTYAKMGVQKNAYNGALLDILLERGRSLREGMSDILEGRLVQGCEQLGVDIGERPVDRRVDHQTGEWS